MQMRVFMGVLMALPARSVKHFATVEKGKQPQNMQQKVDFDFYATNPPRLRKNWRANKNQSGFEETFMSNAQPQPQEKLEEKYQPLGIRAVLAAALMCANKNAKTKDKAVKAA